MSMNKALPPFKDPYQGVRTISLWMVALTLLFISIGIWQLLLRFDQAQFSKLLQLRADFVKNEVIARFGNRGVVLQGMERRWDLNNGMSKEVWNSDAALYYNHYKGVKSFLVLDSAGACRWIFPSEGEQEYKIPLFRDDQGQVIDLFKTTVRGDVSVVPGVRFSDGSHGILMSIPLYRDHVSDGLMLVVFDARQIFDYMLGNIVPGYGISIFANDELIYTRQEYAGAYHKEWEKSLSFELYQVQWRVVIWPGSERFSEVNTSLPTWVLIFGVLVSVSLVYILYLSQLTRIRAKKIDETNRELVYEIVERKLVEDKLKLGQEYFHAIVNEANAFICLVGRDGRVLTMSKYLLRLLGIADEKAASGKSVEEVLPREIAAWLQYACSQVIEKGGDINERKEFVLNGVKVVFRVVLFPLTYAHGYLYAVCCLGIHEKEIGSV